jgi:hypothetical protein
MCLYVDKVINCSKTKDWPYRTSCHLTADSGEELIHFVTSVLGLDARSVKEKHGFKYFILPASLRRTAISYKAVTVDRFIFLGD